MKISGESGEFIENEREQISTTKFSDFIFQLGNIVLLLLKICYYLCESTIKLITPIKKKSVAGEIVLITGAGHGIGKELAIGYASLGATVICWDIHQEMNDATMNEIKRIGISSVYAYKCDVTNREEVFKVAEKVKKEVGIVTILINNAGIGIIKKFLDFSKDDIDRVIDVNLKAHYWTLQAFLPNMIEKNHGHIVALSSILAFLTGENGTSYCSTKVGVAAFMANLEEELRLSSKGTSMIKFTTVYPCIVLTGIIKKFTMNVVLRSFFLPTKKVASLIIDAQRQNLGQKSIPSYCYLCFNILRLLPAKVQCNLSDYIGCSIDE
ncbi:hypothetical protein HN011_002834 [Eciton burchellii]|nr:hypothetical protein HN011_002834 [Eciton burchellii]